MKKDHQKAFKKLFLIILSNPVPIIGQNDQSQGPILESKGMHIIFQEKGTKILKRWKILENLGKNVQNLKIFWKRAGKCIQ